MHIFDVVGLEEMLRDVGLLPVHDPTRHILIVSVSLFIANACDASHREP